MKGDQIPIEREEDKEAEDGSLTTGRSNLRDDSSLD